MAENTNNNYFPDVKTIVAHLKSLKGVDPKEVKKNMHTLRNVSAYIIEFYSISGEMAATIEAQSNSFSKNTMDTQKFMLESLTKMIESINKFNELKIPSMLPLQIRLWKFKKEVNKIAEIFLGRGGIVRKLSAFNVIRAGGVHEEYDENGNVVSKTKVDPLKPADVVKALEDVVDVIVEINNKTTELAAGVFSSYILFNSMWPRLINTGDGKKQPGVLNRYVNLIKSKEFKYLEKEDISSQIDVINNNIESINTIIETITKIDKGTLKKTTIAAKVVNGVIENIKIVIIEISDFGTFAKSKKFDGIEPQINAIKSIIDGMLMLVGEIVILALAFVPLVLAAPLAVGTFAVATLIVWTMAKFSTLIIKIFNSEIGVSVYQGLLLMIALVGVMVLVAGALIALGYIGGVFFAGGLWKNALGMFAVAGLVTLAIAGLGYLITLMLPGITAFTVGVVLVTTAIAAMLLIGVELLALAQFNFDENQRAAIKASTAAIIGAAKDVMDALFNGVSDDGSIQSDNSNPFVKFFKSIFKGAAFMIEALAASVVMVMTTISVTMMLLIGLELNALATYKIDKAGVVRGVSDIMDASQACIDAIFQPADEGETPGGEGFWGALKHFFGGLADILELIAAVGKLALTMVAIAFIKLISVELKWLMNIDIDQTTIVNNTQTIMGAADAVIFAIFQPNDKQPESSGGWFGTAIAHFFSGLADILELIVSIGKLALTLASIALIKCIADQLISLGNMNTSAIEQVPDKVAAVMRSAQACIDAINKPADETNGEGGGFLKKLLKWILPDSLVDMIDMLLKIGKLAMMVMCVGMIHKLAEQLNTIANIKFNESTIRNKIDVIMNCCNVCIDQVLHGARFTKPNREERRHLSDLESFADFMTEFGATLAKLTNSMNKINPRNLQNAIDALTAGMTDQRGRKGTFMDLVIGYVNDIATTKIDTNKYNTNIDSINAMIRTINSLTKIGENGSLDKYKQGIDKAIEFTNTVSTAKLENLKTAANMFEKMADFSKSINGNFEGLADVIEDKIMPLLEKLNETFENTNKVIENGASIPSSAPTTTAPAVSAPAGGQGAQVGAQAPAGINYSAAIDEIRQELSKIHDALTDGSQITRIDD